ncbi:hypothetical protein BHE74_00035325 [Ensete ventricosum]|nr:hypothetical protein BHE74_00035325 [Ensete ventricosum]RZS06509.1 hypothetical protein BHM03_00037166 [Ensete ventricosum]
MQPTSGGAPLPLFRNPPSRTLRQYWRLFNDSGVTPPPLNLGVSTITPEAFQGLTNQVQAIAGMLQAIIPYIPQLAQQSSSQPHAASLSQVGAMLPPEGQPPVTQLADDQHRFPSEFDHAPSGNAVRSPTSTPNASIHSLLDPDTLSSDSTDSLRSQLYLLNQWIDDVHKTIRMKNEYGESHLCGSPFIQEIQDTPILQHFHLLALETYDSGSDPMEYVVAFRA